MNHTQLLNHLVSKYDLKYYLEIGVQTVDQNFNKIQCENKLGVDPAVKSDKVNQMTSDDFFDGLFKNRSKAISHDLYDLIFIDGLHYADQVKKDFENSLLCISDKGFIVIHDCYPTDEITTCVPRGKQKMWHGDVYKFCMELKNYDGIDFITYTFDQGCCVIWKDKSKKGQRTITDNTWAMFKEQGPKFLKVQDEVKI